MKKEHKYLKLCNCPAEENARKVKKIALIASISFTVIVAIIGIILALGMSN